MKSKTHGLKQLLRRRLCFLIAALVPFCAQAGFYSEALMWNPAESGWGIQVMVQARTMFATIFVYGPDNKPTWYVGNATFQSSTGRFDGSLYTVTGPYFGAGAFNPAAVNARQVGTFSFAFATNNDYSGTVTYTVDGVTVTKTVERETLASITLPSQGYGVVASRSDHTCGQLPTGTFLVTFSVSGNSVLTMTDSQGRTFVVDMTATPQHGTIRMGTATSMSVGGASIQSPATDFQVSGATIVGGFFGFGPGNCSASYNAMLQFR